MRLKKYLPYAIRVLIGFVFIFSSLTKLNFLADFEVYLYSLDLLSLNHSYLLARALIGMELVLGPLLIMGIYFKTVKRIIGASLISFSVAPPLHSL